MNREKAKAVSSMNLSTELALTGASSQIRGSRNFPMGNQSSLKPKSQIIINANQGVNMVKRATPVTVVVYSSTPPRFQAMAFPRKNPR